MSITAPLVDPLEKMFSPKEREILQSQEPAQKRAKAALVVKLADAFSFRRAPRDFWQPRFGCFSKAGMVEDVDISRHQLPAMSQYKLEKAEEIMEYVRGTSTRYDRKFSSGMTVDELKDDVLRTSYGLWTEDGKDKHLASIIEKIPNKRHIRKVVCIGLSEIAMRLDQDQRMQVNSLCLAQHLVVLSLVSYIRQIVSHDVELFAADWNYDAPHKEALSSLGFTVLDASYGKQEHFATIDNNTMLICSGIADHESIIPIISEYARPVAMIYDVYDYLTEEPQGTRPALSPLWSRVKHAGAWFTVPGPPLVGTGASERSLPLYTESAGRMLDDYDIAMNLFEFDAIDLANRFELHPNTDWRPADADEREQRRLFGRNSRLFVRK